MKEIINLIPEVIIDKAWELSALDMALKDTYVSFALVYNKKIVVDQFIQAVKDALGYYDFFYAKLVKSQNKVIMKCQYSDGLNAVDFYNPVSLEICNHDETLGVYNKVLLYKNKFISTVIPIASKVKKDVQPVMQLKLTNYTNVAFVGIKWNHVLSDLKGINNFISCICNTL